MVSVVASQDPSAAAGRPSSAAHSVVPVYSAPGPRHAQYSAPNVPGYRAPPARPRPPMGAWGVGAWPKGPPDVWMPS